MLLEKETDLTPEAYLAMEARSPVRHEYLAGQVFAMTGVTRRHNTIALNIAIALRQHLAGKPCDTFLGEVKLGIGRVQAYYYPDIMVTCRPSDATRDDTARVVEDAVLVLEILSPSTEGIDRREKARNYRMLDGLKEYVLVSQDRQWVEVYRREGDIGWLHVDYEPGDTLEFASVGLALPMAALYAGTDTPVTAPPED